MRRRRWSRFAARTARMLLAPALAALSLACASSATWDRFDPDRLVPKAEAPSTSPSPAVPWKPTANATAPASQAKAPELPPWHGAGSTATLEQLIDVALQNNPTTRIAWLQAREAEATLGSRRSAYYPELDLSGQVLRQKQAAPGGRSVFEQTTYGPTFLLTYILFDFGGRASQVEEARQNLITADLLHNAAIQNVVLQVEQAYFQYLNAKALLDAQEATMRELRTNLSVAEGRHDAGVATIADVLQARTALSQGELNRETFEGAAETLRGSLAAALGYPPSTRFEIGLLPAGVTTQAVEDAVETLLTRAQNERPDLAAARAQALRARSRVNEVRAQALPSISLNANLNRTYYGSSGSVPFINNWSASVLFKMPLFTGFRNTWDLREAKLEADVANEQVTSTANQIALQVWTSYYALKTASQRLKTSRDLLASAVQSYDVAQGRYKEGVGGILDLLTAQAALESARAQEVQSRADWFLAIAQLAHDTGTLGT
ncbi:MAG TPA: TolC family protein [Thermoanaerobaculia bacterium]|nr:TolC family protein [Thermoanaerobaculia bacterium]